jgi:hypothetical protein
MGSHRDPRGCNVYLQCISLSMTSAYHFDLLTAVDVLLREEPDEEEDEEEDDGNVPDDEEEDDEEENGGYSVQAYQSYQW